MKSKYYITLFILFSTMMLQAQSMTTNGFKVVVVMNEKTDQLLAIEQIDNLKNNKKLSDQYPDARFYIGILKGTYEIQERVIVPKSGAEIAIYTDNELYFDLKLPENSLIKKGKAKIKIVANKNGELLLKTL